MRGRFIAYYRVSTDKQGKSGLGLEAQRKAVLDYLDGGNWELLTEFTEVESGKQPPFGAREGDRGLQETQGQTGHCQIGSTTRLSRSGSSVRPPLISRQAPR